jgi:hypothetical protein
MSELPWVQFFPSDWLGGTRTLTVVETGVYITLIASMYDQGRPLTDPPDRLARLCGASTKQFVGALETQLREAAGWLHEPAPKLCVTGPIQALIDAGADLHLDVLPVVKANAQRANPTGWNYFIKPIARARDDRIAAATIVNPTPGTPNGTHRKPHSRADNFAVVDAIIAEQKRREDEAERENGGGEVVSLSDFGRSTGSRH